VRERGGAIVVLPDARYAAESPMGRLLRANADARDVLLERPAPLTVAAPLPRLIASELLTFGALDRRADVLARAADPSRAVVWTARRGEGRVLVSGALDAWRFRADAASDFDRFWRAAISGAVLTVAPLVDVHVSPSIVLPLERVTVRARVHRSLASGAAVAATLGSGDVVRLWPDAEVGAFSGTFTAPARAGVSRVTVVATNGPTRAEGSAMLSAALAAGTLAAGTLAPLSMLSASHHGVDVALDNLASLDRWLRGAVTPPAVRVTRRPMRSPWWMLPLVACLSIDWWITSSRRRRG